MTIISQRVAEMKERPIMTGVFTVLAVLSVGIALGVALGFMGPTAASAQVVEPCPCGGVGTIVPVVTGGTTVVPVTTTVVAPTCELSVSEKNLTAPGTVTVSWNIEGPAVTATLNGASISPTGKGSQSVSVSKTTEFELDLVGPDGPGIPCTGKVTVTVPPPTCAFSASPTSITAGGASTLTWAATNAASASISGIGSVSASGGSKSVSPTSDTSYTLTVKGNDGSTKTCPASVTVTKPSPSAPTCTLRASPNSFTGSGASTLSWTTTNAATFSIDNGVGSVSPVAAGSKSVSVTKTTTYTGTATSATGTTVTCTAPVTITTTTPKPACTLAISKSSIVPGDTATLSWTTTNASSASIDQSIGSVTPIAAGSKNVTPSANTTYLLTATGSDGSTVTCPASITVSTTPSPACTLTADDTSLTKGDSTNLHWTTSNVDTITIDNGVGSVTPVASGTVSVSPSVDTTYTATATGPHGTVSCNVPITVTAPGCTSNCGGGGHHGGGGGPRPSVTLVGTSTQPLAYVYLSQIPYTGLDLGPIGTVVYWLGLILWSLALAYLLLFKLLPYLVRRASSFGSEVSHALNANPHATRDNLHDHTYAARAAPAPLPHVEPIVVPHTDPLVSAAPHAAGYSTYDGFRSFAPNTEPLSIEDIVKGLSREPAHAPASKPTPAPRPAFVIPDEEPVSAPAAPAPHPSAAPRTADTANTASVAAGVPEFLSALIGGDREATFQMLRDTIRSGADAEAFLAQIACALDDAYRARTEGAPVNGEVKRMTDAVATPVLERLVTALATAVDSTYSIGITGAKLAVARAFATLGA